MQSSRPTVLQLIGSFEQGGSERQAIQLTRLLVEDGRYRVLVACLSPKGDLRRELQRLDLEPIPSFPLTSFARPSAARQWMRFASYLRANHVQVVQTHDFYTNVFGMFGAALAGVKARIAARRETGGVRTAAQLRVEHLAYRCAHSIVANAQAVRDQLVKEGTRESKVATIYNGFDVARMTPTPGMARDQVLASFGLPPVPDRKYVTIVANLRLPVKDYPMFLQSARIIVQDRPEAAFLIAGEGPLTDSMRELARELGIGDRVFFLGRCERVQDLLAVSDVCVLTSKNEGFSNSILEYMGAGRPVVATSVGGAPEVIQHGRTGYLVPPGGSDQLAAHVIHLLRHPQESVSMGARGKLEIEARFSLAAQLKSTLALYDTLLARASALTES